MSGYADQIGSILLSDEFESASFGFNSSIWTLHTKNAPTLEWRNSNITVLHAKMWKCTTLESMLETGPSAIVDFEISYTEGQCYFGIGWADEFQDPKAEWASNLRASQNGVFVDYWDNQLFLVSSREGKQVSTPIMNTSLKEMQQFRLVWTESLVRLLIDEKQVACHSVHIPLTPLSFIVTLCGQHSLVKNDQLELDSIVIGTRNRIFSDAAPVISLLWPQNESCLYDFDYIDLEIEGNISNVYCSWNGLSNFTLSLPWDISVLDLNGSNLLNVFAADTSGRWSSSTFQFHIIIQQSSIMIPAVTKQPLIDGVLSSEEEQHYTNVTTTLRCEDRSDRQMYLFMGFCEDYLYLSVLTTLHDKHYSRISLYIDGEGDGVWGNSPNSPQDICITVPTPTANPEFRGIRNSNGEKIELAGVVYVCGVSERVVVAEFLVSLESIVGNSSVGIGVGVVVSQGGFDSFYPVNLSNEESHSLISVKSMGLREAFVFDGLVPILLVGIIFGFLIPGAKYLGVKGKVPLIEESLPDERLERVRTLLESYPDMTIERLSLMANTDIKSTRESIDALIRRGLFEKTIFVSEGRIERNN